MIYIIKSILVIFSVSYILGILWSPISNLKLLGIIISIFASFIVVLASRSMMAKHVYIKYMFFIFCAIGALSQVFIFYFDDWGNMRILLIRSIYLLCFIVLAITIYFYPNEPITKIDNDSKKWG